MIMSGDGFFELDRMAAEDFLNRLVVGAYLDSFNVSSLSVTLRLVSPVAVPGRSIFVDCAFSCDAFMCGVAVADTTPESNKFFAHRAIFIARVFSCIGEVVDAVDLCENGGLSVSFGSHVVELRVSMDDDGQDESVWDVAAEESARKLLPTVHSLACVLSDSRISFVAGGTG